ncbi:hypothetical protein PMAYCL1PPCAC_22120, partial [Pristionchus mayeri]
APGQYLALRDGRFQSEFLEEYRNNSPDAPNCLGIIFARTLLSSCATLSSLAVAIVCFAITVYLRGKTIKRFIKFETSMSDATKAHQSQLSMALNVQLVSSSFFFVGVLWY